MADVTGAGEESRDMVSRSGKKGRVFGETKGGVAEGEGRTGQEGGKKERAGGLAEVRVEGGRKR